MKVLIEGVAKWMCNQCGHIWNIRCENEPPVHCASCGHRGWSREREVDSELAGA
jgi:rubrerythrin